MILQFEQNGVVYSGPKRDLLALIDAMGNDKDEPFLISDKINVRYPLVSKEIKDVKAFTFNCNSNVKVRLTKYGIEILRDRHERLWSGTRYYEPFELMLDDQGYYVTQMWILMYVLGASLNVTNQPAFDLNIIVEQGREI